MERDEADQPTMTYSKGPKTMTNRINLPVLNTAELAIAIDSGAITEGIGPFAGVSDYELTQADWVGHVVEARGDFVLGDVVTVTGTTASIWRSLERFFADEGTQIAYARECAEGTVAVMSKEDHADFLADAAGWSDGLIAGIFAALSDDGIADDCTRQSIGIRYLEFVREIIADTTDVGATLDAIERGSFSVAVPLLAKLRRLEIGYDQADALGDEAIDGCRRAGIAVDTSDVERVVLTVSQ